MIKASEAVWKRASFRVTGNLRKDGKIKIRYCYPGAPNMFGGYEFDKFFTKLRTLEELEELRNDTLYDEEH